MSINTSEIIRGLLLIWSRPKQYTQGQVANWTATCPRCHTDAEWASSPEPVQGHIRYAINCQPCGPIAWRSIDYTGTTIKINPWQPRCRTCDGEGWTLAGRCPTCAGHP